MKFLFGPCCLGETPQADSPLSCLNVLFFCGTCGQVWGRLEAHPEANWVGERRNCLDHPAYITSEIAGSLLSPHLMLEDVRALLEAHPALQRHEFFAHLRAAETIRDL